MKTIYLDHNATSLPKKEHLTELFNKLTECLGNPSSPHAVGREASVSLTEARRAVAKVLGVDVSEIIFVSGGSEADNLGTVSVIRQNEIPINKQHAITSAFEHPAIREPLENLKNTEGLNLTLLSTENSGFVSLIDLIKNLTPETTLITLMAANNEIGTIQPVKRIGDFLHYKRWGILLNTNDKDEFEDLTLKYLNPDISQESLRKLHYHVDGVQSFGRIKSSEWLSPGVDSCAISAHKIGALQGVGALFLRRGRKFKPLILGGAQEKNRRAGTENLPGIVSFGLIARDLFTSEWETKINIMDQLRRKLYEGIQHLPNTEMNSPLEHVIPNTVNFSVVGSKEFNGEDLLVELDMQGVCASSGSACSSGANLPSKVILAIGKSPELAKNAIRLSLSTSTTEQEIDTTLKILKKYLVR